MAPDIHIEQHFGAARIAGVKAMYPVELIQAPTPEQRQQIRADLATALTQTGADVAQNSLGLTGAGVKVGVGGSVAVNLISSDTRALIENGAVIEAREKYKDLFAKKHDIRLGFMGFFAKAACLALKDIPAVNARIEGDEIVYHPYVDMSVAVSAPNGLVVPVVRDVQDMSFAQIEKAIADYGKKAKDGKVVDGDFEVVDDGKK